MKIRHEKKSPILFHCERKSPTPSLRRHGATRSHAALRKRLLRYILYISSTAMEGVQRSTAYRGGMCDSSRGGNRVQKKKETH
ncbi:hypothetical protein EYF80_011822 [Liparis tanakae]|uniref:Uncharacterized protein n=1 Tax=Liparis tanakae TaxID=230148 RepID=A0A4Z2IIV1_9TELE|nr:hypothetical protein EYF80_011822 [Liparis tanakae]